MIPQPVEAGAVGGELGAHSLVVGRVPRPADLDEGQQYLAALDVGEELVAEPGPFARALRSTRARRRGRLAKPSPEIVHAQRLDRRERVGGDLRRGVGWSLRKQRGLAGVGQTDQAGVGHQLEPQSAIQPDSAAAPCRFLRQSAAPAGSSRRSACCRARRHPLRRPRRAGPRRVADWPAGQLRDDGARRGPGASRSLPRAPWRCLPWAQAPPRPARKWGERPSAARSRRRHGDEHDPPATAAVAAVSARCAGRGPRGGR